ncbi:MAG: hypothetical protein NPINA01_23980 [Nitrospinaceae bacterium]|nr:MAG: hypothetical protein NPINA01_23980 [Nitrospinaceae bacterium]
MSGKKSPAQRKTFILVFVISVQLFIPVEALKAQPGASQNPASQRERVDIPKEPGWKDPSYRGWEVMSIPGLISTYYDLDLDGKLDYMVIRKILQKATAESTDIDQAIAIAKHEGMSVYFSHPIIYFTHRHPLFYCMGVDYRRNCRDIWVDIAEDGLNGNEELYTLSTPSIGVR